MGPRTVTIISNIIPMFSTVSLLDLDLVKYCCLQVTAGREFLVDVSISGSPGHSRLGYRL
jgi:hypothetical protein